MFEIKFVGTAETLKEIQALPFTQFKITSTSGNSTKGVIYEVESIESLYKVDKNSSLPIFFLISTQSRSVIEKIKGYRVTGLILRPLDAVKIEAKMQQSIDTSSTIAPNDFEVIRIKLMAIAENIPPLPTLAHELIELTDRSETVINHLTAKIRQDQGITTRLIKLVNSPFYGIRQEITSISRATVLLGFSTVKNIVLALSIDSFYNKQFDLYNTTGEAMWAHSYRVAVLSQMIVNYGKLPYDPELMYLAGLLHDIGKVVMIDLLVKPVSNSDDERAQLGLDHTEVSCMILSRWALLGKRVSQAIAGHHNKFAPGEAQVIYYANLLDRVGTEEKERTLNTICSRFRIIEIDEFKEKAMELINERQ